MQSVVVALALSTASALVAPSRPAARAAPLEAATISLPATVKPGVVTGEALVDLLSYAKEKGFAIPAVNAVSSCGINACMEAAAKFGGPMIVQFSRGGGQFLAGKFIGNQEPDKASVAGCVAGALQGLVASAPVTPFKTARAAARDVLVGLLAADLPAGAYLSDGEATEASPGAREHAAPGIL